MKNFLLFFSFVFLTFSSFGQLANQNNPKLKEKDRRIYKEQQITNYNAPESQVIIFQEDFNGSEGAFTINTITGPAPWKWTNSGHTGDYPTTALGSTTSGNGWMIVDSDADNFSGGPLEHTELISPVIDCSLYPNIVVSFEQMFRRYQADTCLVMVSNDGGATFPGKYYVNPSIDQTGTDNPDLKMINISSEAGSQSQVVFKFVWYGAWDYGWQIDDVMLMEQPANDLELTGMALNMTGSGPGGFRDYYGKVPLTQVTDIEYGVGINNFGSQTQYNVTSTIDCQESGMSVYNDVVNHGTITSDSSFAAYHSNWYNPSSIGVYEATFTISADSTDEEPTNNSGMVLQEITDGEYNPFGSGDKLSSISGTFYTGGDDGFKLANLFEMEAADEITSVSVGLRTGTSTSTGNCYSCPGALIQVSVFDSAGVVGGNPGQTLLYSDFYTLTEADTTAGIAHIHIPQISPLTGVSQNRMLQPGGYYVAIETYSNAGNSPVTIYDDQTMPRGAWSSIIYIAGEQWYTNGDAFWIQANFGFEASIGNNDFVSEISLYPNPSKGQSTLNYDLSENGNVIINIHNIDGKIVKSIKEGYKTAGKHSKSLNLDKFKNGIYRYDIIVNDNISSGKIVLSK